MNLESYFAVKREILTDGLFLKNPAMGWFFLYCHSQAMFRDHLSPCNQIDQVIQLKKGQFWKSVRAFAKECPVASKSTLSRWSKKLEETGHLKVEIVGKKKWDTLVEKVGHPSLKYGTGICVVTVQKYLINSDDGPKGGTAPLGTLGTKKWDTPPPICGTRRIRIKNNKKGDQLSFVDGGTGGDSVVDLGRPGLAVAGKSEILTVAHLPENIRMDLKAIQRTGSPLRVSFGTVSKD